MQILQKILHRFVHQNGHLVVNQEYNLIVSPLFDAMKASDVSKKVRLMF